LGIIRRRWGTVRQIQLGSGKLEGKFMRIRATLKDIERDPLDIGTLMDFISVTLRISVLKNTSSGTFQIFIRTPPRKIESIVWQWTINIKWRTE
jgi:hypothetical protein